MFRRSHCFMNADLWPSVAGRRQVRFVVDPALSSRRLKSDGAPFSLRNDFASELLAFFFFLEGCDEAMGWESYAEEYVAPSNSCACLSVVPQQESVAEAGADGDANVLEPFRGGSVRHADVASSR